MPFQKTEKSHIVLNPRDSPQLALDRSPKVPREKLSHHTTIYYTESPGEDSDLTGVSGV